MLAKVLSFGLHGIEAYPVEIEVDVSRGLPALNLVGLPDSAVKESNLPLLVVPVLKREQPHFLFF